MPEISITPAPTYDFANVSTCVPQDQFIQFLQVVVYKQDAINLGIGCFVAGMLFYWALDHYSPQIEKWLSRGK